MLFSDCRGGAGCVCCVWEWAAVVGLRQPEVATDSRVEALEVHSSLGWSWGGMKTVHSLFWRS